MATFTRSADVAGVYAAEAHHREDLLGHGAVGMYVLAMRRPLVLAEDEDVLTLGALIERFSEADTRHPNWGPELIHGAMDSWREEGEPIEPAEVEEIFRKQSDCERVWEIYTDNHLLLDQPLFKTLMIELGYDGVISWGTFTNSVLFTRSVAEAVRFGGYDDRFLAAQEYRVVDPRQVRFAFAPHQSIEHSLSEGRGAGRPRRLEGVREHALELTP
jgi:hypothetical protein